MCVCSRKKAVNQSTLEKLNVEAHVCAKLGVVGVCGAHFRLRGMARLDRVFLMCYLRAHVCLCGVGLCRARC